MLSLKFQDYEINALRKEGFHGVFGHGIFTTDGPQWEHSRTMLRPNFNRSQVADLGIFETHIQNLIKAIPTDGSTVDLQPLFFDLTLDSATEFLFGESANTLHKSASPLTGENFGEAFTYCTTAIGNSLRVGRLDRYYKTDKRFDKDQKLIHDFADRYVMKAIEHHENEKHGRLPLHEKGGRYVFLHELAKQTQDPLALRSETLNILLAGRDTTASLLANVWNIIPKRPDVWSKLLVEVDQLDGRKPTFEEMKNMKYLKYMLNECEWAKPKPKPNRATLTPYQTSFTNISPFQVSDSGPSFQTTHALPFATPSSHEVVDRTANPPFSSKKARRSPTASTACIDARTSTGPTLLNSDLSDGNLSDLAGSTCHLMAGRGSVLVVSFTLLFLLKAHPKSSLSI